MFTFGSDPEFMLQKNNEIYSAINIIDGDVANRVCIGGHQYYYDNVLAECAIKPGKSKEETLDNFRECLQIFKNIISPYFLLTKPAHHYTANAIKDPRAKKTGCSPEVCAYTLKNLPNRASVQIKHGNLRTAGGHIHLGFEIPTDIDKFTYKTLFVRALDLFVGIPSVLLEKDKTLALKRHSQVGDPGSHRKTPYGVEYRTLSNFWLHSPQLVSMVYDLCELCLKFMEDGHYKDVWQGENLDNQAYNESLVIQAINTHDSNIANQFIEEYLPKEIINRINSHKEIEYKSFYEEWNLT